MKEGGAVCCEHIDPIFYFTEEYDYGEVIMGDKKINNKIMRILCMLIGNIVIGLGVACMRLAAFGTDPFSCMNIGVSSHLPISYGTYQAIVNIVLFIPVIILKPRSFGVGALVNMLGLGYIVDGFMWVFQMCGVTIEAISPFYIGRGGILIAGILFLSFGVALYMNSDLGVAPYDMIAQIVDDLTHGEMPFKWARIMLDCISIMIGFISGGTFGVATFVVGFFTGPLVSAFRKLTEPWFVQKQ